jgi:uncharacterized protein (TIRG00374 family)
MQETSKKILLTTGKIAVSLLFLYWLIIKINWHDVIFYAQKISLWQILIYFLLFFLSTSISAYKWSLLAQSKKFSISFKESLNLYLAGAFINNFMPSFIGGDTYKAYVLGKLDSEKRYAKAASTVILDRLTGLLGTMLLALFFGILNWRIIGTYPFFALLLSVIGGGLLILFVLEKSTKYVFGEKLSQKLPKKILEFIKILHQYYLDKKLFLRAISFAILFAFVGLALLNSIMFWALGIKISMLNYLSVIFLISIVSSIPLSINNIGVQEWAYVTFFGIFGVDPAAVITVSIVIRILQMLASFTALPFYLKNKFKKNK